jgi:hypothetical protein
MGLLCLRLSKFFVLWCVAFSLAWAVPPNDGFVDAESVTGDYAEIEAAVSGATREPGEPLVSSLSSVWYKWTAPGSGTLEVGIDFRVQDYRNTFDVFVGDSVSELVELGVFENAPLLTRKSIPVIIGGTYYVRVAGPNENAFGLFFDFDPQPEGEAVIQSASWKNDFYEDAVALSGSSIQAIGYGANATRQDGEPSASGYSTLWWKWKAPSSGKTVFSIQAGVIMVCVADSLTMPLTQMHVGGQFAMDCVIGQTYHIGMGGYSHEFNLPKILTISHTPDGGTSAGSGVGARFKTLNRHIFDRTRITGYFTDPKVATWRIKLPPGLSMVNQVWNKVSN